MIVLRETFNRYPNAKRLNEGACHLLEKDVINKYGRVCEICGYTIHDWIPVLHHRDCNPGNNVVENIMPVCYPCHAHWHRIYPNWRLLTDGAIKSIVEHGSRLINHKLIGLKGEIQKLEIRLSLLKELQRKTDLFYGGDNIIKHYKHKAGFYEICEVKYIAKDLDEVMKIRGF